MVMGRIKKITRWFKMTVNELYKKLNLNLCPKCKKNFLTISKIMNPYDIQYWCRTCNEWIVEID